MENFQFLCSVVFEGMLFIAIHILLIILIHEDVIYDIEPRNFVGL